MQARHCNIFKVMFGRNIHHHSHQSESIQTIEADDSCFCIDLKGNAAHAQVISDDEQSNNISTYKRIMQSPVQSRKWREHESKRTTSTLNSVRNSYRDNFTVHGLSKVFIGWGWEWLVWFIVLITSLGTVSFFAHQFYREYIHFDIRTETRVKTSTNITIPAVTICQSPQFTLSYCFKNMTIILGRYKQCPSANLLDRFHIPYCQYFLPRPVYPYCFIFNHFANITSANELLQQIYVCICISLDGFKKLQLKSNLLAP